MILKSIYRPRRQFYDFHQREQRWAALVCHRRAGKTVAAVNDLVEKALYTQKPDARYGYIAPYYSQAKQVAFDYLMRYSEPFRKTHNVAELSVQLINGSRVRLFGGDNPDALRGLYLDGVVIDEPAQLRENLFREVVRPALADRKGWAVFIGTPQGKANDFYKICEHARQDPDWYFMVLRASESGILPPDELADMRKVMDEDEYNQELECSFDAAIKGSYYGRIINGMGERLGEVPHDPFLPVHLSLDLGFTDTTACWTWQTLGEEVRYIWAYQRSGWALADHIAYLQERGWQWGDFWVPHDARAKSLQTGNSIIELLVKDHGVRPLMVPSLSVQQGIQAARRLLMTCYIDETECAEGVEMLRQYQREYDEVNRCFKQNPKHDLASNYADSFRYSALIAHKGAREAANRIAPLRQPQKYDPSLPFGGQVRLGHHDDNADWMKIVHDDRERI